MTDVPCALYARVSSESQARDNTIASQVAALRERIVADGFLLEPDHSYEDEGYSGSILSRPALERLRDAVAGRGIAYEYRGIALSAKKDSWDGFLIRKAIGGSSDYYSARGSRSPRLQRAA